MDKSEMLQERWCDGIDGKDHGTWFHFYLVRMHFLKSVMRSNTDKIAIIGKLIHMQKQTQPRVN